MYIHKYGCHVAWISGSLWIVLYCLLDSSFADGRSTWRLFNFLGKLLIFFLFGGLWGHSWNLETHLGPCLFPWLLRGAQFHLQTINARGPGSWADQAAWLRGERVVEERRFSPRSFSDGAQGQQAAVVCLLPCARGAGLLLSGRALLLNGQEWDYWPWAPVLCETRRGTKKKTEVANTEL